VNLFALFIAQIELLKNSRMKRAHRRHFGARRSSFALSEVMLFRLCQTSVERAEQNRQSKHDKYKFYIFHHLSPHFAFNRLSTFQALFPKIEFSSRMLSVNVNGGKIVKRL